MGNKTSRENEKEYWVGFDLGGTKMYAAVLDADLKIVGTPKRSSTKGHDGAAKGLARIISTITAALKNAGVAPSQLAGIGIGCPGVVDLQKGILLDATNLGWKNVGIAKALTTAFSTHVSVLNDVDAGTFGEFQRGCGRGASNILGIFPGTGLGGGAILGGRLVCGSRISSMEIGNMALPSAALGDAPWGSVRIEDICSRLAIASAAIQEAYRGGAPYLLKNYGTDIKNIKSRAISESIANGDEAVERIVLRAIHYLGMGVAAALDLLGPDIVAVGGGLAEAMPELFVDRLKTEVAQFAFAPLAKQAKFKLAELGDNAVVTGAAAYCQDEVRAK